VRAEVVKMAEDALVAAAMCTGNKDIEPFVPTLCSCVARPDEIGETVEKLAATTFVQAVEPPAMALMVPVLSRGLLDRATATKRKSSVIIDNMCKLVTEPRFAKAFLPKLRPDLVSGGGRIQPSAAALARRLATRWAGCPPTASTPQLPPARDESDLCAH